MVKRIAFLASELAGYLAVCQKRLQQAYNLKLLIIHWPSAPEAPFAEELFEHFDYRLNKAKHTYQELQEALKNFDPDALVISGWMDKDYLKLGKIFKKKGVPIIAGCDTQWKGGIRQFIGQVIAPYYLHSSIDILWVTGDRQRKLARKLGYQGDRCWIGYYACDWEKFRIVEPRKLAEAKKAFLYVGRYIPRKGIDILVAAYRLYRKEVEDPWDLWTAGTGPEVHILNNELGIKNLGFVQPTNLPALFKQVAAFVLPSRVEPWGVVVQEAASAGLPLICSNASGASDHLLIPEKNGYLFESNNTHQLAKAMQRLSAMPEQEWNAMSKKSFELSKQYTPEGWANTLVKGLIRLNQQKEIGAK